MLKAGVVGLGTIGGGVAVCLARVGMLAGVYDVRSNAVDTLAGVPPVAPSVAALMDDIDVLFIAVLSDKQVIDVLQGPDGALSKARKGQIVVILSTVDPTEFEKIRAMTEEAGLDIIDSAVTGGPAAAENGLICLVGGKADVIARAMPVLDGFAKEVVQMGGPGAGMAAKIVRNTIVFNVWRAGQEARALARALGIDIAKLAHVIDSSADSVGGPSTWMKRKDVSDPEERAVREHTLILANKDLDIALALAEKLGVDLPSTKLTRATTPEILDLS